MLYKTLNNSVSRILIEQAVRGQYRFCAYGLFNKHNLYNTCTYNRLFKRIKSILVKKGLFERIFEDSSIDYLVRAYIKTTDAKIEKTVILENTPA